MAALSTPHPVVTVQIPQAKPTATVIWCHGLGDSPNGWSSFCATLAKHFPGGYVKFVLPYAPDAPVTCNFGSAMPSWMDLIEIPIKPTSPDNGKQQEESIAIIHGLIEAEVASGIPANRIVLGGFSQGGALSLAAAVAYKASALGGCAVLSGWALPHQDLATNLPTSTSLQSPWLVCHGNADPVVEYECGTNVHALLTASGATNATLKTYEGMPHSSCDAEEIDVLEFLKAALPAL